MLQDFVDDETLPLHHKPQSSNLTPVCLLVCASSRQRQISNDDICVVWKAACTSNVLLCF